MVKLTFPSSLCQRRTLSITYPHSTIYSTATGQAPLWKHITAEKRKKIDEKLCIIKTKIGTVSQNINQNYEIITQILTCQAKMSQKSKKINKLITWKFYDTQSNFNFLHQKMKYWFRIDQPWVCFYYLTCLTSWRLFLCVCNNISDLTLLHFMQRQVCGHVAAFQCNASCFIIFLNSALHIYFDFLENLVEQGQVDFQLHHQRFSSF